MIHVDVDLPVVLEVSESKVLSTLSKIILPYLVKIMPVN